MDIVVAFAEQWNNNPFFIMDQDIDDFIIVAKTMVAKHNKTKNISKQNTGKNQVERIRVNDKTATGGWF